MEEAHEVCDGEHWLPTCQDLGSPGRPITGHVDKELSRLGQPR